jgi:phage portal protein BeeE
LNAKASQLVLPNGDPVPDSWLKPREKTGPSVKSMYGSYLKSLYGLELPSMRKAEQPFIHHPWVYSAAMLAAINIAQVPYYVYIETDEEVNARAAQTKSRGQKWYGPMSGLKRRAIQRHLIGQKRRRAAGLRCRGLEPDWNHEFMDVLLKPNDLMTANEFWQVTILWLWLRGGLYWVCLAEEDRPLAPGEMPTEIWPISPDLIRPKIVGGVLQGWEYYTPGSWLGKASHGFRKRALFERHEIIAFRFVDPTDPLGMISPLAAAASGIKGDMMAIDHNSSLLENNAEPGGVLIFPEEYEGDEKEVGKFVRRFEERHEGPRNSRRTAVLRGGITYQPTSLSPRDMDFMGQREWNRDEELAVMRTPRSVVGVTENLNYATQLGSDRNYWDKNLLPTMFGIERTLDGTLFFEQPDNVMGMFDTTNVEPLRVGLEDKIGMAINLAGSVLRLPPRQALERAGVEGIEEYEGDDQVLVAPNMVKIDDVLNPPDPAPEGPMPEAPPVGGDGEEEIENENDDKPRAPKGDPRTKASKRQRAQQKFFESRQTQAERIVATQYARWVKKVFQEQLDVFDSVTRTKGLRLWHNAPFTKSPLDVGGILVKLAGWKKMLQTAMRGIEHTILELAFETAISDIGGMAVFELDHPEILEVFRNRVIKLADTVPHRIHEKLKTDLAAGFGLGETVQDLRKRIAETLNVESSSSKVLTIARTESGGMLNDARDKMFSLQGLRHFEWSSASDEHVRESHRIFGAAGPRPAGFNWLELTGKEGKLTRPHDPEAPADEVINCRCCVIPVRVKT